MQERKILELLIDTVETVNASMQAVSIVSDAAMNIDKGDKATLMIMQEDYKKLAKMFDNDDGRKEEEEE